MVPMPSWGPGLLMGGQRVPPGCCWPEQVQPCYRLSAPARAPQASSGTCLVLVFLGTWVSSIPGPSPGPGPLEGKATAGPVQGLCEQAGMGGVFPGTPLSPSM